MRTLILISLVCLGQNIFAQGIRDSLFRIGTVEVHSRTEFEKEHAGMKTIHLDTAILQYQLTSDLSVLLKENTSIITKDYGRGALSTASFRGTTPSHTSVSWNGININSPMLGMVDFSLVPMFIVDEMNLQHGAASVEADGGALGGLIEIRNRPDWSGRFSGKAYAGFGSFGTSHAYTRINAGTRNFRSSTRLYSEQSHNNYPFANKNIILKDSVTGELVHPVVRNKNAAFRKMGISQGFYLKAGDKNMISNRTWIQEANRSIPTVLSNEYDSEILSRENLQADRTLKNVTEFNHYGARTDVRILSGIDLQQLNYSMQSRVIGYHLVQSVNSGSRMKGWYNTVETDHEFTDRFSVKFKASLNRYQISTHDTASLTGYEKTRQEESIFGGFYYQPLESIQLSIQLRKEFTNSHQVPLIYVAGLTYKPLPGKQFYLKANFSRNFHVPSLNDLYWQPGGNPDLLPEQGHTAEAGMDFIASSELLSVKSSLTGFRSDIQNWILWLPGYKGFWEPVNIDQVRSFGLEYHLNVITAIGKTQMRLFGNLALTRTFSLGDSFVASEGSGRQLPFVPVIAGNINASVEKNGYYLVFQNNSMGQRYLLNGDAAPGEETGHIESGSYTENFYTLYPHFLNNLTIGKAFRQKYGNFTLELDIDNLFNETYRNILQRFMPGRSYMIHLKYDF